MPKETHRWVIDSIEEFVASIEVDGDRVVQLPQWILPRAAKEGDVLSVTHDLAESGQESRLSVVVDQAGTRAALDHSARQVGRGTRSPHDPGGDIKL